MKNKPSNISRQSALSLTEDKIYISKGPIFDGKYIHSSKIRYVAGLIIALVVVISVLIRFHGSDKEVIEVSDQPQTISVAIKPNDNYTKLSRQALASYLDTHTDVSLSNAQRLFIETSLVQARNKAPLKVGEAVEFSTKNIESLVSKSQNLTALQIKAWSDLARGIKY